VLVHGFTQTGRCWGPVSDDLADDQEVVSVDAPGHGRSAHVRAVLRVGAELIANAGGEATYLGYSMGARFCLHVALERPEVVRRLVLVGGTAGIDEPAERAARRAQDDATANRIEEVGLGTFLEEWLSQPLFAGIPSSRQLVAERMDNTVAGLQSSLRRAGTGAQEPSWSRLPELAMPVLVVAGADDDKFAALGRRLVEGIGDNAELTLIDGAGHAAHLEQPHGFLAAVRPWLAAQGG
jgi:2-succinyl-6-hydroxy-2,4-cyclohexadiene-1-carboxylate synthase